MWKTLFDNLDDLEEAVRDHLGMIENLYMQNLNRSVPRRLVPVIDRFGDLQSINFLIFENLLSMCLLNFANFFKEFLILASHAVVRDTCL